MSDSTYEFTEGSGTTARSTTDGSGNHSPNTVVEYQNGSTQPQPVSESNRLPVLDRSAVSSVTESTGGVTTSSSSILSSNSSRKGGYIQNETDTDIWVSLGGTATTAAPSSRVRAYGGTLSLIIDGKNVYTGAVTAIHGGSGTKNVTVVEC